MDEVLKELGPKENPNKDSSMRLIPPAKVVGEGTPPPACTPPLGYGTWEITAAEHCCNVRQERFIASQRSGRSAGFVRGSS